MTERRARPTIWRRLFAAVAIAIHLAPLALGGSILAILVASTVYANGEIDFSPWVAAYGDLDRWASLAGTSALSAAVAIVVCATIGSGLAVVVFKTDVHARFVCISLLVFGSALPLFVVNAAVIRTIGAASLDGSAIGLGVVHGISHVPIWALLVGLGLRAVPPLWEEAALVDGASSWRVLTRVSAPAARASLAAASTLVVLWLLTDYSASDVIRVRTLPEEIYTLYALNRPREAVLIALPQILLLGPLIWVARGAFIVRPLELPPGARPWRVALGGARMPVSIFAVVVCALWVTVPLATVANPFPGQQTLGYYFRLFAPEIRTSLWTAATGAAICAALAAGCAWMWVRQPGWRRAVAITSVVLLAMPAPLVGVGLVRMFSSSEFLGVVYDSPFILSLAYAVRFFPLAILLLLPAMRTFPVELESVAAIDGCRDRVEIGSRLVHPLFARWTAVVFLAITILAVGELPASILVAPPDFTTMGMRFFSLIHYGMTAEAGALCSIVALLLAVPTVALLLLGRRF